MEENKPSQNSARVIKSAKVLCHQKQSFVGSGLTFSFFSSPLFGFRSVPQSNSWLPNPCWTAETDQASLHIPAVNILLFHIAIIVLGHDKLLIYDEDQSLGKLKLLTEQTREEFDDFPWTWYFLLSEARNGVLNHLVSLMNNWGTSQESSMYEYSNRSLYCLYCMWSFIWNVLKICRPFRNQGPAYGNQKAQPFLEITVSLRALKLNSFNSWIHGVVPCPRIISYSQSQWTIGVLTQDFWGLF